MGVEPTGKSPNGSENSALDQSAKLTRRRLCNSITILKTGLVCVCVCVCGWRSSIPGIGNFLPKCDFVLFVL